MNNLPYMPPETRKAWGYTDGQLKRDDQAYGDARAKGPREPEETGYSKVSKDGRVRKVRVATSDGDSLIIGTATSQVQACEMRLAWYQEHRPERAVLDGAKYRLRKAQERAERRASLA